ncbi:MAG: tetratricopeptide repeat protein [Minicystis sp.]
MIRYLLPGLLALLCALAPAPAAAQPTVSAAKAAAREKAAQGLSLFEAKRWAEAYAIFKEADDLYHVPTLTLAMAQCQSALGRLIEARDLYRRVLDEPVAPDAPEPIRKARVTAAGDLAALERRIPVLTVTITGPDADRARVEIDGAPASARDLAVGRAIDPGEHIVSAVTDGGGSARLTVKLPEGARTQVELAIRAPGSAAASADRPGSMVPAGVAFGLGGAGVAAGAITGIVARIKSNDIRGRCQTIDGALHCLAADIPARDTAIALRTASTAAFVAGGAALAAGTVLAIVRPGGGKAPVEVTAGVGSIGIRGRF